MIVPMILSILAAFFFASTNHIDKFLMTKVKGVDYRALCIVSAMVAGGAMALIYAVICGFDFGFDLQSFLILMANAAIGAFVANLFYFKAMARDDATIVVIMFQLIPVFMLLLAPLLLPDQGIRPLQLVGGLVITAAAIWITYEPDKKKFSAKKLVTLGMMAISSLAYAAWFIVVRFVNLTHDFNKTTLWSNIALCLVGFAVFVFAKTYRKSFLKMMRANGSKVIGMNLGNELISSFGGVISTFAGTLTSVALVSFISQGVQPFAVMALGILLTKLFPKIEREKVGRKEVIRRLLTIVICIIGLACIEFG